MSYQGQMSMVVDSTTIIMVVETTGVEHLHNTALGYYQLRLKQGTISICIEECIGGGGITLCRRKLARMTGWGSSLNFLPRRQHHCIIASRLTGECVWQRSGADDWSDATQQRNEAVHPLHWCSPQCNPPPKLHSAEKRFVLLSTSLQGFAKYSLHRTHPPSSGLMVHLLKTVPPQCQGLPRTLLLRPKISAKSHWYSWLLCFAFCILVFVNSQRDLLQLGKHCLQF